MTDLAIIIPFYNESKILNSFLVNLSNELQSFKGSVLIVFVDDNSFDNSSDIVDNFNFNQNISFVKLKHIINSGHQKAIKTGLNFLSDIDFKRVLIMDSDGEDDPRNISSLLRVDGAIIVASRGTRNEPILFKALYFIYKVLFRLLVNKSLDFGNFTVVSKKIAFELTKLNFIHYPASILKLKVPINKVKLNKAKRLGGTKSKLNFQFFVYHGLYSFLEFSETVFFKIIKILAYLIIFFISIIGYVLFQKIFTNNTIPGWSSSILILVGISILLISNIIITGILITYYGKKQEITEYEKH